MRRPGLPVVLSAVLSAIASGDGGSFSEGGSLLGLRSFSEVGGVDWRAGKKGGVQRTDWRKFRWQLERRHRHPNTAITVEYGNDLVGWTTAVDDNNNVEIEVPPGTPTDAVVVKLKRSTLGATGKIFARLKVVVPPCPARRLT